MTFGEMLQLSHRFNDIKTGPNSLKMERFANMTLDMALAFGSQDKYANYLCSAIIEEMEG